jgi:hypothetical protein
VRLGTTCVRSLLTACGCGNSDGGPLPDAPPASHTRVTEIGEICMELQPLLQHMLGAGGAACTAGMFSDVAAGLAIALTVGDLSK